MQNLNLYQLERTQQSGPRPAQMLLGLGVLLLLCMGHASWQAWQLHHGAQRLAEKQLQAQQEEAQLASALGSFIEPTLDERLPEELAARGGAAYSSAGAQPGPGVAAGVLAASGAECRIQRA